MSDTVYNALALIIPLVFAIVFHEVAHGMVAKWRGDPTAAQLNRLSLNPLRHVDPIGTVLLPGLLALAKAPIFGWAKPVPVVKARLNNPRRDMMLVAAAGPGMNLVMAVIGAALLGLLLRPYAGVQEPAGAVGFIVQNLKNFVGINVFLALFNLLPIPPFDGSHIVEGLLPERAAAWFAKVRQFGMLPVILLLVVLPSFMPGLDLVPRLLGAPYTWLIGKYAAITNAFL